MSSSLNAIKLVTAMVAGALFMPWQSAEACTTGAWSSVTGTPFAGSPRTATEVRRYSGECGLAAIAPFPSYVTEATQHSGEGGATPYRARFFVHTGAEPGTVPVVFRAVDAGDASVVEVSYNAEAQNFAFTVNGNTLSTPVASAPRDRWIQVRLNYQAGQPFTASTIRQDVETMLGAGLTASASLIDAVNVGVVAGSSGNGVMHFDEFEASRSTEMAESPFAPVCRGDANGDGNLNIFDVVGINNEILGNALRTGEPDCNEDGLVNIFDTVCTAGRAVAGATCN